MEKSFILFLSNSALFYIFRFNFIVLDRGSFSAFAAGLLFITRFLSARIAFESSRG
jgi:hypothetical protein